MPESLTRPSPQAIAALVPMVRLFDHLGIPVNERTHRCLCPLHGGTNRTAFSWTENGLWHCFSCGRSGDKYDLIRVVLRCDFPEALKVMAVLAGVDLGTVSPAKRRRIRAQQRKERRLDTAAERYAGLERRWLCRYASRLRLLDRLEGLAAFCLRESPSVGFDAEFWWSALARVYGGRWQTLAAWLLLAFGAEDERQRFVLYADVQPSLLVDVLDAGGITDERGHWREISA